MSVEETVTEWLKNKKNLVPFTEDFQIFFKKAIQYAQEKDKTFFGSRPGSISLIIGGIYLASWVLSGKDEGLWMVLSELPKDLDSRFSTSIIKSTKKLPFDLFWLHSKNPEVLSFLISDEFQWDSFAKGSKLIFQTRHGKFIREDFIYDKVPISLYSKKFILKKNDLDFEFEKNIEKSKIDNRENRLKRLEKNENKFPKQVISQSSTFLRNPDVVTETLHRANGYCEKCGNPAPFRRKSNNEPYLEVHHKIHLSKGGADILENTLALCPNCHRELHFGKEKNDN